MVPKLLTTEQKESRMNICADILNNIDTDPGLLDMVTLKGTRFESVEAVKAKATEVLNQLTEADFQHCFQQWKSRMERLIRMSEITAKVAKPQMRRLLHNQIRTNIIATGVSVLIAGLGMKFLFGDKNKSDYVNFYKTYDVDKEFERMRKKGLFESCDSDD
ncbi:hypothetical protein NQ318_013100 [Aromia moschata]|uniref:Uncharacterized protein n=1 Tax=Aromia moschata TaxID=1265417 RepID=A0AAV8Y176_9CUCU|nr:hypothetical protein NQ318_013100 [Aromia moschata]